MWQAVAENKAQLIVRDGRTRLICTCGYENLPGVTVCLMCKGLIVKKSDRGKMMRCTNCGCKNSNYAVVCEQCGAYLTKEEPAVEKKDSILDPLGAKKIRCAYCWSQNEVSETYDLSNAVCSVRGMRLAYVPYPEKEGEYGAPIRPEIKVPDNAKVVEPPLPEGMVRCRNCGMVNPVTEALCGHCGYQLSRDGHGDFRKMRLLQEQTDYHPQDAPASKFKRECESWKVNDALLQQAEEPNVPEKKVVPKYNTIGRKICTCGYQNLPQVNVCLKCGGRIVTERDIVQDGKKLCTCGYKNLRGVTVCLMCKGLVTERCSHCGFPNPGDAKVCSNCLKKIDAGGGSGTGE